MNDKDLMCVLQLVQNNTEQIQNSLNSSYVLFGPIANGGPLNATFHLLEEDDSITRLGERGGRLLVKFQCKHLKKLRHIF